MSFNSKYSGQQVENLLDQVASGNAGGGGSSNIRNEIIYIDEPQSTIVSMRPNVIYWICGSVRVVIDSFEEPLQEVDSYDVFTAIMSLWNTGGDNETVSLTLPDYVLWANGVMPDLSSGDFELSISRISDGYDSAYRAVLTPFKGVEE